MTGIFSYSGYGFSIDKGDKPVYDVEWEKWFWSGAVPPKVYVPGKRPQVRSLLA